MTDNPSDNSVEEQKREVFIHFPNPRHPDTEDYNDYDDAQRYFDAVEELIELLGPDVRIVFGEAAHAAFEADTRHGNENPEPMMEFANKVLKGSGYRVELVEETDE